MTHLQNHLDQMVKRLIIDDIQSFKVGITEDVDGRKQQPDYRGYQLCVIAIGEPEEIIKAEKEAIAFFLASPVSKKCENKGEAAGAGNVENAKQLYIAIKFVSSDRKGCLECYSIQLSSREPKSIFNMPSI